MKIPSGLLDWQGQDAKASFHLEGSSGQRLQEFGFKADGIHASCHVLTSAGDVLRTWFEIHPGVAEFVDIIYDGVLRDSHANPNPGKVWNGTAIKVCQYNSRGKTGKLSGLKYVKPIVQARNREKEPNYTGDDIASSLGTIKLQLFRREQGTKDSRANGTEQNTIPEQSSPAAERAPNFEQCLNWYEVNENRYKSAEGPFEVGFVDGTYITNKGDGPSARVKKHWSADYKLFADVTFHLRSSADLRKQGFEDVPDYQASSPPPTKEKASKKTTESTASATNSSLNVEGDPENKTPSVAPLKKAKATKKPAESRGTAANPSSNAEEDHEDSSAMVPSKKAKAKKKPTKSKAATTSSLNGEGDQDSQASSFVLHKKAGTKKKPADSKTAIIVPSPSAEGAQDNNETSAAAPSEKAKDENRAAGSIANAANSFATNEDGQDKKTFTDKPPILIEEPADDLSFQNNRTENQSTIVANHDDLQHTTANALQVIATTRGSESPKTIDEPVLLSKYAGASRHLFPAAPGAAVQEPDARKHTVHSFGDVLLRCHKQDVVSSIQKSKMEPLESDMISDLKNRKKGTVLRGQKGSPANSAFLERAQSQIVSRDFEESLSTRTRQSSEPVKDPGPTFELNFSSSTQSTNGLKSQELGAGTYQPSTPPPRQISRALIPEDLSRLNRDSSPSPSESSTEVAEAEEIETIRKSSQQISVGSLQNRSRNNQSCSTIDQLSQDFALRTPESSKKPSFQTSTPGYDINQLKIKANSAEIPGVPAAQAKCHWQNKPLANSLLMESKQTQPQLQDWVTELRNEEHNSPTLQSRGTARQNLSCLTSQTVEKRKSDSISGDAGLEDPSHPRKTLTAPALRRSEESARALMAAQARLAAAERHREELDKMMERAVQCEKARKLNQEAEELERENQRRLERLRALYGNSETN